MNNLQRAFEDPNIQADLLRKVEAAAAEAEGLQKDRLQALARLLREKFSDVAVRLLCIEISNYIDGNRRGLARFLQEFDCDPDPRPNYERDEI